MAGTSTTRQPCCYARSRTEAFSTNLKKGFPPPGRELANLFFGFLNVIRAVMALVVVGVFTLSQGTEGKKE